MVPLFPRNLHIKLLNEAKYHLRTNATASFAHVVDSGLLLAHQCGTTIDFML
jgi:hypothetical protein